GRVYNLFAKSRMFESVPYVLKGSVEGVIERQRQEQPYLKDFDFSKSVDNSWSTNSSGKVFSNGFSGRRLERNSKRSRRCPMDGRILVNVHWCTGDLTDNSK